MNTQEELLWLVLHCLSGNSRSQFLRLQSLDNDPKAILAAGDATWAGAGISKALISARRSWRGEPMQLAQRQQETLNKVGGFLLPFCAQSYPPLLAEIADPPPLLYLRGERKCLREAGLAIVGSRKASSTGRRAAAEFSRGMVAAGLVVASGLAEGIDSTAHRAALDAGGATIAVMATGIDVCYPRRHRQLAEDIAAAGLLITEFPPGSRPLRERFPQRNRIISGISLGVLVVEAAQRSGSLITARMALEQNREVFALPHSIYHPGGRGCNALLRDGAKLVETTADVLEELGELWGAQQRAQARSEWPGITPASTKGGPLTLAESRGRHSLSALPALAASIYRQMATDPVTVDELAALCQCDAGKVLGALTELQLAGLLDSVDGRYSKL